MNYLLYITVIGLLSGVIGTAGGGLGVVFIKKIRDQLLSIVLGISAGIMTVVIFLDLIPEAHEVGTISSALLGIMLGVLLIAWLDIRYPHIHFSFIKDVNEDQGRYLKAGLLLSIGIALHNVPEGLAIGAGFMASRQLGINLAILMAVQNFPEGMAVATALGLAGLKSAYILLITALAGVPMGIGAFVGGYLGGISDWVLSVSLGFAAGAMLYIVFDELIPDAHKKAKGHSAIAGILAGILLGIILTDLLH